MKIGLLLNTCEPFYRGGYERRAWAFARELVRQGHQVRVYTSCPRREKIEGVEFVPLVPARAYFNAKGVRNGWADGLFVLALLPLFWKWRRGEEEILEICATPFLHLPLIAALIGGKQIPAILTCHEALRKSLPAYAQERGWKGPAAWGLTHFLSGLYRLGMSSFPVRLAVSQETAHALLREGYPAASVVPFGLEPETFRPDEPTAFPAERPVSFIYCGRLTPIKSVSETIRALAQIRELSFQFHIIGEGSCRAELEKQTRDLSLENKVTFYGEVSEPRKRELLAQAEVFVLSSPREGFSIATLEAMAQGCTAIIQDDPRFPNGARDFVEHRKNGWILQAQEPDALSHALRLLLQDSPLRLTLRQAAWKQAQDYRIEKQARLLLNFYQRAKLGLSSLPHE